jgi:hypothetical protein
VIAFEARDTLSRSRLQRQLRRSESREQRAHVRAGRRAAASLAKLVAWCTAFGQLQAVLRGIRLWLARAGHP